MHPELYLASTERELEELARQGLLVESHHIELKREIPAGPSANKELARDLAALAVDGGVFYVGIQEGKHGEAPQLWPVDLAGLPERVDQVARTAVSPPLKTIIRPIPASQNPGKGYLAVQVPLSGDAPHMVDNRYWGRANCTKEVLPDSTVRRLFELRTSRKADGDALLGEVVASDPTPADLRRQSHLFVVAKPLFSQADQLLRVMGEAEPWRWVQTYIRDGKACALPQIGSPDLPGMAGCFSRRAKGWAIHTYEISADRTIRPNGNLPADEGSLLELELDEDGSLRLFCGRASDDNSNGNAVFEQIIASLTRRVLHAAGTVAEQSSYFGPWIVGVAVTNLRGRTSYLVSKQFRSTPAPYSMDDYREVIEVQFDELVMGVGDVLERLLGRLNRSLNGGLLDLHALAGDSSA